MNNRKLFWVIFGIIVLLIFFSCKIYFKSNHARLSPILARTGGFSCINTDGPCQGKTLGSSCESNGVQGWCSGSLTNDWKWTCTCKAPIKTGIYSN